MIPTKFNTAAAATKKPEVKPKVNPEVMDEVTMYYAGPDALLVSQALAAAVTTVLVVIAPSRAVFRIQDVNAHPGDLYHLSWGQAAFFLAQIAGITLLHAGLFFKDFERPWLMRISLAATTLLQAFFALPAFAVTASYLAFPGRGVAANEVPVDVRHATVGLMTACFLYTLVDIANGLLGCCRRRKMAAGKQTDMV